MKILDVMLDILLAVVFFGALFGFIVTQLNGVSWSSLNIAGTTYNLSWAPFIIVLVLVIILIYYGYRYLSKK